MPVASILAMTKISVLLHLTVLLDFVGKNQSFGHDFKRSTLFHKIKEGEALNGHVISVHQVRSELACAHKCHSNHRCASLNFEAQSARSLRTCELNAVSRTSSDKTLQSRDGFTYYEPLTIVKKPQQEITTLTPTTSDVLIKTAASTPTETTVSPSVVSTTAAGTKAAYCGPDWYPYKAGCLRFFENHKKWSQANDYCKSSSGGSGTGRLISILSENENENVTQWWSSLSHSKGHYFIGLNDMAAEGTFQWVDGTDALYTNWKGKNGPNNNKNKNCVRIRTQNEKNHGKWEIKSCEHSSRFICECPEGPCT
ncbi:uncharacterized protein [Montipora foliosa]|uniref:uncharacterized protein isoform X1 n=1 Tax=Montipora foliosa TaxID=591990 RepID=UPI0035F20707